MILGIIGHGADKFTPETEWEARHMITTLLLKKDVECLVSGHSPVGGVDIWAEDLAILLGIPTDIKAPVQMSWDGAYGFKARNIDIAETSDEVHVILAAEYPPGYCGRRFDSCYHCHSDTHVKSGACWTAKHAKKLGKVVEYHVIEEKA
jgi:hypothetical protein